MAFRFFWRDMLECNCGMQVDECDAKWQGQRWGTIVKGNGFPSRFGRVSWKQNKDIPERKFGI